jgi:two-component system nitrogen regulation response regulator GlnG
MLTDYCIARSAFEMKRDLPVIPDETRQSLRQYDWPGNIRELQSILKQAYLQMSGNVLLPEYLPPLKGGSTPSPDSSGIHPSNDKSPILNWDRFITERLGTGSRELYSECLTLMERQLIVKVLQRTGGNQLRAAELLGITRSTLRQKMRLLNITLEKSSVVTEDEDG